MGVRMYWTLVVVQGFRLSVIRSGKEHLTGFCVYFSNKVLQGFSCFP